MSFSMSGTIRFSTTLVDGDKSWAETVSRLLQFTNGTASGQADAYWQGSITLGPGDDQTIDFYSLAISAFGASGTVAMASVKMLVIANESANVSLTVEPGASNGWDQLGGLYVGKGGVLLLHSGLAGLPVGGTSRTLKITNNGTTTSLSGNTTSASAAVTGLSSTSGLVVGMAVIGAGIPANAKIASITNATAVTLTANATATATGVSLDFQWPDAVVNVYAVGIAD